jgi:hypothetical protein
MEKNIGKVDASLRVIVGLVALYLAFKVNAWWLILAAIIFLTVLRRNCWLYSLLGISTAGKKQSVNTKKKKKK